MSPLKKIKKADSTVRENLLLALINNLPILAFSGTQRDNFVLDFVSEGAYELTGYSKSDFLKDRTLLLTIIHPDDLKEVLYLIKSILKTNKHYEIIHRVITAEGEMKWVISSGFATFSDGLHTGIEGFIFDITGAKRVGEYREKSERRFRNLFESNPHGIAIADKDGFIVQANKNWKKMFGYTDNDMCKLHMNDFRCENDKVSDFPLLKSIIKGEDVLYRIERQFIKKDGSLFWCDLTATLIENPDEDLPYAIGLYSDITERKKIEERLKRFQEELAILVSERTEEINMLTQKVINSQEEERQRIARDLHDGVGQTILAAKYAINSFAKDGNRDKNLLERGKLLIDMASQELREVYTGIYPSMLSDLGLSDTINWLIRNFLETSGIIVNYRNTLIENITYNLKVNIYRIIQELFNNIVKHSNAKSVEISLSQDKELIIIELSDNGIGFNIENSRKTGTGAGLINIRQRVEFLKGHIEMSSNPGITWIKIKLPLEKS